MDVFFQSYAPYQYLLQQRNELPLFFQHSMQNPGAVTLEDYSKKIQNFLDLAEKIKKRGRERKRTRGDGSRGRNAPLGGEDKDDESSTAALKRERTTGVEGARKSMLKELPGNADYVVRGMFLIDCRGLNAQLASLAEESALSILQHMADDLVGRSHDIKENFKKTMGILNKKPTTSQELVSAEDFLQLVDSETLDELLRDV